MTGGGGRQRKFCLQPFGQSPHFRHSRAAISKNSAKFYFKIFCFVLGNAIIKPKSPCVVKTYTPIKPFFLKIQIPKYCLMPKKKNYTSLFQFTFATLRAAYRTRKGLVMIKLVIRHGLSHNFFFYSQATYLDVQLHYFLTLQFIVYF